MVTQGTNENGSNKKRNYSKTNEGERRYAKPGGDGKKVNRPDGGYRGKGYSRSDSQGNNRFGNAQRYDKKKNYAPRFPSKDEDDEDNSRRSHSSRPKETKSGVAIPEKDKTKLRLEMEKKKKKSKQQNREKGSNRPQPRLKRQNNVNYTRSYANGDYDDYEDYYDDY